MASGSIPISPGGANHGFFSNFSNFINVSGATHQLKLRQNFKASKQLRIEIGVDWNIKTNQSKPYSGIKLVLDEDKPSGWAIEVNTDWAVVQTPRLDLFSFTDKLSLPVSLRLGTDFYNNDAPHVEVGLHNAKVAVALLLGMLYLEKPISVKRRETGLWTVGVPVKFKDGRETPYTLGGGLEMDASLARKGRSLTIDFTQLNGVLRNRQDD